MIHKSKTIIIFEGLSSSGKSTTIEILIKRMEMVDYKFIRYTKTTPINVDNLHGDFDRIVLESKHWLNTSFRISRFGIFINDFLKDINHEIAILDRGLLTMYLEAVTQGIPHEIINPFVENFAKNLNKMNYLTFFMNANKGLANKRVLERVEEEIIDQKMDAAKAHRARLRGKSKLNRNERHFEYYNQLETFKFLGEIHMLDSNETKYERSAKALSIIQNSINKLQNR